MPDIVVLSKKKDNPVLQEPSIQASRTLKEETPVQSNTQSISSLTESLDNFSFSLQEPNERILLVIRKHFITNVPWIFTSIVFLVIPLIIKIILANFPSLLAIEESFPTKLILPGTIFYYLIVATYALVNFLNWFYNITLITQKRIISLTYSELIYHDLAIMELDTVGDVRYSQSGVLQSLFNYGNLIIQTTLEGNNFETNAIPHPKEVTYFIESLIGKEETHA